MFRLSKPVRRLYSSEHEDDDGGDCGKMMMLMMIGVEDGSGSKSQ